MAGDILPALKVCGRCNVEKPISAFGKHKIMKDGLMILCRECVSAKNRAAYQANKDIRKVKSAEYRARTKDKKAAHSAIYRAANKEKISAKDAEYRAANAEAIRAKKAVAYAAIPVSESRRKARSYYLKNKERANALSAQWRENNRYKIRAIQQNYRALKRGAGKASVQIAEKLMKLQRGKCACCRVDLSSAAYHIDHIEPLSRGGRNEDANLQLLCRHCNQTKHAKLPHEFMQEHGFLL